MFNRRKLDRERLEVYLVHMFLAYRPQIFVCGMIILLIAFATLLRSLLLGGLLSLLAVIPLLMSLHYSAVVFFARLGAWAATIGRKM
jgi:hypothetical protein